jgi:hypothetical protein
MAIPLTNTAVAMQNTLGTSKTITAISKASEASVTATHDFSVGDYVVFDDDIGGMTELINRVARVKSVSTTVSFVCEGLDSTNFATFTSGGTVSKITAFHSLSNVISFNFPEPQPNRIDITTIHDSQKKEMFGLDDAATISLPIIADPTSTVMTAVRTAALAKTLRAFKVTLQNGNILIFNAYVAGGRGLDGAAGEAAKGSISLVLASTEQFFTS